MPNSSPFCSNPNGDKNVVKKELSKRGVLVINVEKKSHEDAYKCSYMVEVQDRASFVLVMSGSVLPPDVGVRQWKSGQNKKQAANNGGASWPAPRRQDRGNNSSISSVSSSQSL